VGGIRGSARRRMPPGSARNAKDHCERSRTGDRSTGSCGGFGARNHHSTCQDFCRYCLQSACGHDDDWRDQGRHSNPDEVPQADAAFHRWHAREPRSVRTSARGGRRLVPPSVRSKCPWYGTPRLLLLW